MAESKTIISDLYSFINIQSNRLYQCGNVRPIINLLLRKQDIKTLYINTVNGDYLVINNAYELYTDDIHDSQRVYNQIVNMLMDDRPEHVIINN